MKTFVEMGKPLCFTCETRTIAVSSKKAILISQQSVFISKASTCFISFLREKLLFSIEIKRKHQRKSTKLSTRLASASVEEFSERESRKSKQKHREKLTKSSTKMSDFNQFSKTFDHSSKSERKPSKPSRSNKRKSTHLSTSKLDESASVFQWSNKIQALSTSPVEPASTSLLFDSVDKKDILPFLTCNVDDFDEDSNEQEQT